MNDLLETVKETIHQHHLLKNGDRVLVGLSGGADSVCLLKVLLALAGEMHLSVSAAHLHHGLRDREADEDEAFVKKLCTENGVPLFIQHVDIRHMAKEQGTGLEETGRIARYAFFNEVKTANGLDVIATAHHAGDNVETVLMRLLRGTGPLGLGGIPYRNGDVVRPLLDVTRLDILLFLKENNQAFRTDSTNAETSFTRNRVRNLLVPTIERDFNPNFQQNFKEQIQIYAACSSYLEEQTEALLSRVGHAMPLGYGFSREALLNEPSFLVSMLLHCVISRLSSSRETGMMAVRSAEAILYSGKGRQDLGGGVLAEVCHGSFYIRKCKQAVPFAFAVHADNRYKIAETGQVVAFSSVTNVPVKAEANTAYFSMESLAGKKLMLRSRQPGDYFYPSGMNGKKKLKNFMIDEKIPYFLRDEIPVFTADEDIVWVAGKRSDARYVARAGEHAALCVTILRGEKH